MNSAHNPPSNVLILRGLSADITEKMISDYLISKSYFPEYIRIIKDKNTGSSKGIAIVRFKSTEIATEVLETYPQIEIMDTVGWFEFGFEHTDDDWTCKICNNINFRHRSVCFKCLSPKILKALESTNYGQDDISKLPTRFLLLRNIDNSLSAKKIFDVTSVYEGNLIRVWLVQNRDSKLSQSFSFLEFSTISAATNFISRQSNLGVPLKIGCNEIVLTYGRDLDLLSQTIPGSNTIGAITYWDNSLEFSEFPVSSHNIADEKNNVNLRSSYLGLPSKRSIAGSVPTLSRVGPPKKIQIQLKSWTEKAQSSIASIEDRPSCDFVSENSKKQPQKVFIDNSSLFCTLCDIKFSSESELMDHAKNSLDHSHNFDAYLKKSIELDHKIYHDRAAERREAFGENEEEVRQKIKESTTQKIAAVTPIASEPNAPEYSFGAKILKKMGWAEGSGLGKDSTGIVEPIKAKTVLHSGAGIGASNFISADEIESKNYVDIVKTKRNQRFNDK